MENYPKLYFKGIGKPKNYKELLINFYQKNFLGIHAFSTKMVYYDEEMTKVQFQGYAYRSLTSLYALCKGWFPRITYYKLIKFLSTCKIGFLINCPTLNKITYYSSVDRRHMSILISNSKSTCVEKIEGKYLYEWRNIIENDLKNENIK